MLFHRALSLLHTTPMQTYFCIHTYCTTGLPRIRFQLVNKAFGFSTGAFFQNKLINMYANWGSWIDARKVFDEMTKQDVFSWNVIITAYRRYGCSHEALKLFNQMQQTGIQPDQFTFASILPACGKIGILGQGMDIHQSIIESGFSSDVVVANSLIDMYAKCGNIQKAREVFDNMPQRDVISWNVMIAGYAQIGFLEEASQLFKEMSQRDVVSWNAMISGYVQKGFLDEAFRLFSVMPQRDVISWNTMIAAYAQRGFLEEASRIFKEMPQPNVVSWNTMIAGHTKNGDLDKALRFFNEMPHRDIVTWDAIIAGYAQNGILDKTLRFFKEMPHKTVNSWTAMISGYAQNGDLDKALRLFKEMPQRNVVSWNAMIAGYAQNGLIENALETFKQMQLAAVKPNSTTFASILPACAKMGALEHGMDIHQSIIESGFLSDGVLGSALVDTYAKCGSIHKARKLFDRMSLLDVISWNGMIAGYSQNGLPEKALETFKEMKFAGVTPDSATFAGILPACAKIGALDQGMDIHQIIIESGFLSDVLVVSALVDMYAKCGSLRKAREVFEKMSQRDTVSWNVMIAGYAMHGFRKDALKLFELMEHSGIYPDHVSFVCVLFACSHDGTVTEGCKYFNDMRETYCIMPTMDHYICMVDLLGRANYLEEALNIIIKMPIKPALVVWICLLGACRSYKDIGLGIFVSTLLFDLDPKNTAPYVLLSNIYAEVGRWGDVQEIRRLMKDRGIKKMPGCSWIEVHNLVHVFLQETDHILN
ncbi:pentatricopeptide repeat-containing protein At4g02750 [Cryptomeria japonica]|uniref:pentatricopeptide repeat-containing protein At4g02750 n=1 Tax=Cryptomeria japonica TaxID=3369 RepID=UPI0027DA0D62|nr:pentatricopeptide repeat-containing protein At4g02750 [Cryptomeria japonica]XP_057826392.2 pentatricopeptide repeat-containing protein At4g02750 [Cryptomeria japonica]XP_057826397.2 pentatricopeptide repeat-containing protein At4g02750 [Cryptomeria japonica]XP_057826406.2 pentatricopeptide repeat-containing protein At4g02750 [Cryptomeria japonica]XP_057826443.2 pentatricopeptide repeat-containing protein At4g02750 [Cryptomeria japonica]